MYSGLSAGDEMVLIWSEPPQWFKVLFLWATQGFKSLQQSLLGGLTAINKSLGREGWDSDKLHRGGRLLHDSCLVLYYSLLTRLVLILKTMCPQHNYMAWSKGLGGQCKGCHCFLCPGQSDTARPSSVLLPMCLESHIPISFNSGNISLYFYEHGRVSKALGSNADCFLPPASSTTNY